MQSLRRGRASSDIRIVFSLVYREGDLSLPLWRMLRMRIFRKAWFLLSWMTVCAGLAHAQTTATLTGTIKDPQGGVLPGASITVHSIATGADRVMTSDGAGDFVVPSL